MEHYFTDQKFNKVKCMFCGNIYNKNYIMGQKIHLYRKHKIYFETDRLEWMTNSDPIWNFFTKIELFCARCNFCMKIYNGYPIYSLRAHLNHRHQFPGIQKPRSKEPRTRVLRRSSLRNPANAHLWNLAKPHDSNLKLRNRTQESAYCRGA